MLIRQLGPADAAVYQALRLEALRESPTAFNSSHEEECDRPMQQVAQKLDPSSGRHVFGAFEGEALVAIAAVAREARLKERHRAFLGSVYVRPLRRGTGVSETLLKHVLAFADTLPGLLQVNLIVTADNASALRLYRGLGFVEWGRAPGSLQVAGTLYDEIHMVRQVNLAAGDA